MFYTGDDISIVLTSNDSLDGAEVKVFYKKPFDKNHETVEPTHVDVDSGTVTYELQAIDNDIAGDWRFWLEVIDAEQKKASSTEVVVSINSH